MMESNKVKKRFDTAFLNGFRIFLASWVAVGHFYHYLGGIHFFRIPKLSEIVLGNGPAVDGFMIITGFLMTFHYDLKEREMPPASTHTIFRFWIRRILRLAPLYYVCLLLAAVCLNWNRMIAPINYEFFTGLTVHLKDTLDPDYAVGGKDYLSHLLFLHGLWPGLNTSILGPAWSLSTEMQFYLLFPLIYLRFFKGGPQRRSSYFWIIVTAALLQALTIQLTGIWDTPGSLLSMGAPSLITHKLFFFTCGIVTAKTLIRETGFFNIGLLLVFGLAIHINIYAFLLLLFFELYIFFEQCSGYIPLAIRSALENLKRLMSGRKTQYLGELSYGIYLVHYIVMPFSMYLAIEFLGAVASKAIVAAVAFGIFVIFTLLLSILLNKYVEEPFIRISKSLKTRIIDTKATKLL